MGELINVPYQNRCKTQHMHGQCGNIIRRSEYVLSLTRKATRLLSIPPFLSQNPTGIEFLTRLWQMEADTLERLWLVNGKEYLRNSLWYYQRYSSSFYIKGIWRHTHTHTHTNTHTYIHTQYIYIYIYIYINLRITSFRRFYAGNFRNGNLRLYIVLVQREVFRVKLL
jgi:hypothetical protein